MGGEGPTVDQDVNAATECRYAVSFKYVLPYVKNRKVLDVGCSTGEYLARFRGDSVGVDASVPSLRLLSKRDLIGIQADLNGGLPFRSESFDAVFCSHTLEHIDRPIQLLRESRRVLKRGGYIVIALPLEKSLVRFILRDHYFKDHPTHLHSFSLHRLVGLLEEGGLRYCECFVDTPGATRFHLTALMDMAQGMPFWLSRWFSGNFWVVGQKP